MNKLWPGWDATLKENGVEDVTSISKFKKLQLSMIITNLVLSCAVSEFYSSTFLASEISRHYEILDCCTHLSQNTSSLLLTQRKTGSHKKM